MPIMTNHSIREYYSDLNQRNRRFYPIEVYLPIYFLDFILTQYGKVSGMEWLLLEQDRLIAKGVKTEVALLGSAGLILLARRRMPKERWHRDKKCWCKKQHPME